MRPLPPLLTMVKTESGQRARSVVFLVRSPPVASGWTSEALRVAVGMTLAEGNRITVVFLGSGVLAMAPQNPESAEALGLREHIETLRELGVRLVVEREACARFGIFPEVAEAADRDVVVSLLANAEALQTW